MKKIAVVLSGCGYQDGAEIIESVSTLVLLSQKGVNYKLFAPNIDANSTNHLTGESGPTRNTLTEAARIARGEVSNLDALFTKDFDAIVFPGGFGVALHLSDWSSNGSKCKVLPDVERVINEFYEASNPIGAMCIAPALIARVLGKKSITVTIGNDSETAKESEKTGAYHEECPVDDYITDRGHKIVTTPAYMYNAKPHEVYKGISGMLDELVEMA